MTDDELDNQLRGAMKVLDAEVPSGYFEGLPQRTLARLEDRSMEPTMTTGSGKTEAAAPPPQRDEDSGLHDIRSLAQSTKQRLSKKITAVPPMDDDVLASSSAGWKAVALPEPAKMISLPELDQLPSKKQIKEQQKKAKVVEAVPTRAPTHLEDSAAFHAPRAGAGPVAVTAAPAASMSFGANIVAQRKSKAPLYALVGVGLAAAAGGIVYVTTQGKTAEAPPIVAKADTTPTPPPPPAPPPPAPAAQIAAPETPPADTAAATGSAEATPPVETAPVVVPTKKGKPTKGDASKKVVVDAPAKPESKKPEAPKGAVGKEAPKDGSEPNFDDLLKEAGVKDGQKAKKPVLDKKSLSGADFKTGMNSIAGKAAACYAGTQGTAAVKLTVAPSGQVSRASVSGPFAGTAVAACVEAAVRGASFPAWEGGPQSFNYSFLLAE